MHTYKYRLRWELFQMDIKLFRNSKPKCGFTVLSTSQRGAWSVQKYETETQWEKCTGTCFHSGNKEGSRCKWRGLRRPTRHLWDKCYHWECPGLRQEGATQAGSDWELDSLWGALKDKSGRKNRGQWQKELVFQVTSAGLDGTPRVTLFRMNGTRILSQIHFATESSAHVKAQIHAVFKKNVEQVGAGA